LTTARRLIGTKLTLSVTSKVRALIVVTRHDSEIPRVVADPLVIAAHVEPRSVSNREAAIVAAVVSREEPPIMRVTAPLVATNPASPTPSRITVTMSSMSVNPRRAAQRRVERAITASTQCA
jgi:hypothetical protein